MLAQREKTQKFDRQSSLRGHGTASLPTASSHHKPKAVSIITWLKVRAPLASISINETFALYLETVDALYIVVYSMSQVPLSRNGRGTPWGVKISLNMCSADIITGKSKAEQQVQRVKVILLAHFDLVSVSSY